MTEVSSLECEGVRVCEGLDESFSGESSEVLELLSEFVLCLFTARYELFAPLWPSCLDRKLTPRGKTIVLASSNTDPTPLATVTWPTGNPALSSHVIRVPDQANTEPCRIPAQTEGRQTLLVK